VKNADEAVWFEAYKPEEEPQISEWAAPVAETVEVEPEEEVQEEPEKEPEEEETQEVVQEELEKDPEGIVFPSSLSIDLTSPF